MIHGLRGDEQAHQEWTAILDRVGTTGGRVHGYGPVFEAMLLLHRGQPARALEPLAAEPGEVWKWVTWIWLHWYVGLRTEAAVLAGDASAAGRLVSARSMVAGNPVAEAMVERAQALFDGDPERVAATAPAFEAAGSRYQAARSLLLAGGVHATRGRAALAELGFA
ncbi:hypothetical protein AB0F81_48400 [Actinoplanes sp. NPDC024001]|uniref:hypothetical protein n=1 Tax=Actinoplanes sp. NPDC024001 TaxID=3154598 RepID=UPI0033E35606